MVKVFTTNKNGKIEFTKEELEKLLNEVWDNGYKHNGSCWWTWKSPTITARSNYYDYITCGTTQDTKIWCCDSTKE